MTIKKARAALSHSVFTGISRNHLDRLVTELTEPFHAAREGRLRQRRGDRDRQRWPGAGHPETLTLRDRLLLTLTWLRLALPHQALGLIYGIDRSTVSTAIRQIRPLLANRGFATPTGQRLHTLADVLAYAAAEHAIAKIKWWRTLQRFTGRRDALPDTIRAITSLASDRAATRQTHHNTQLN